MSYKNGLTLLPTGDCFEDCTLKFAELLRNSKHRENPLFFLVHGICLMDDGDPYSHAWLELDGHAIQCMIRQDTGERVGASMPVADFHTEMRVQEFTRYSWRDVIAAAIKYGDIPPPWELKYRRLTREGKKHKK